MVTERVVLCRVEHFEQGCGRVTRPAAGGELVDLVEQDHRVHGAGLLDRLDDPARLRADVGAAVAANLGFVTDPAERDTDELASHRPSDRLPERGLAHARRTDEGEHRSVAASIVMV